MRKRRSALLATLGLAAVIGATVAPVGAASADAPAAAPSGAPAGSAVRAVALPGGAHIHVRDHDGTTDVVREPGDSPIVVNRVGGHVYALPLGALTSRAPLQWSRYDLASHPQQAHPDYPQVTATLDLTLPSDPAPIQVAATIVNTDDARKYANTLSINNGTQQLSLPKGHYSVIAFCESRDKVAKEYIAAFAFAVDQDIESDDQVIHVDLTKAVRTGYPTYSVPGHGKVLGNQEDYAIADGSGRHPGGDWQSFDARGFVMNAEPMTGGTYGRLISDNDTSVQVRPGGPIYYLSQAHENAIVPDEHVDVTPDQVTAIDRHNYGDPTIQEGLAGRTAHYSYYDPGSESFNETPIPGIRQEYVRGSAGVSWFVDTQADTARGAEGMTGYVRYRPGTQIREDVWRGPLAPGVANQPRGADVLPEGGPRTCFVCRTATGMVAGLTSAVSSNPRFGALLFAGPGQKPTETQLRVYRDGEQVASIDNSQAGLESGSPARFDTPADQHDYRIVQTTNRKVDGLALSTRSTSDYRFPSSATSGPRLGTGWDCAAPGNGACTVLPLLAVHVPLPTSLTGTLPAGRTFVVVTVDHVQGAAATPITGLDLSIRSGGGDWTPQTVESLGGGRYYVAIDNTAAAGVAVDMRWHASDSAGSSLTQTVQSAYTIEGN